MVEARPEGETAVRMPRRRLYPLNRESPTLKLANSHFQGAQGTARLNATWPFAFGWPSAPRMPRRHAGPARYSLAAERHVTALLPAEPIGLYRGYH